MKYLDSIIDCSHFNTINSFRTVKEFGITAIFHKATEGTANKDAKYFARKEGCEAEGILFGAYHFGSSGDVNLQVDNFLSIVNPTDNSNILMALDYEASSRQMSFKQAIAFIQRVFDLTGKWIGIYGGSTLKEALQTNDIGILINCWLWISHYTTKEKLKYPSQFPRWTFWQYTDKGQVDGIAGNVDRNYFKGTEEQLTKLWNG